ncbi:hypothetical protein ACF3MZ_30655 [Paenibacillaceae bacterium WGS1546]|uniref:hypothetical protein n=1 Tax=Cohnella sp. WGS1546 TaxID=3366810 RepID=UPI00372D47DA
MLKKSVIAAWITAFGFLALVGNAFHPAFASGEPAQEQTVQKRIRKVQQMPSLPEPYSMKDWRETALAYDRFVFDFSRQGEFLPTGWWDRTHFNMDEDTFGLMSYVGKFGQGADGTQEAINMMAAVLGATLVGIDKSDQSGHNYVHMLQTFYNKDNGENVILNNPDTVSGQTFWYELLPHILFYALSSYYPDVKNMDDIMRSTADLWAAAVQELGGKYGRADFDYTAFNFYKMEPFRNDKWTEPDAAAGVAMLAYMAYAKFGDPAYLKAAELSMDFMQRQMDNPLYEVLLYFAPYVAARMNAEQGTQYDVNKFVNWVFDGGSKARDGWGTIVERWGEYDAHGLFGSLNDNGGYAFAMNTFAAFGALAPVVRYDPRYARDIGKWMLNAANQSRLFYADALPPDHQSGAGWTGDPERVIPYEGLRKELKGVTPYASGDPTVYAWGNTDFSLYSGSYVGFLGGLIEKTDVEGILKIDCLKTDYFHDRAYPTFLYYNPYDSGKRVQMTGLGSEPVDLFDAVTGKFVARGAKERATLQIAGDHAAVLVVVPAGSKVSAKQGRQWIDGVYVAPVAKPAVNILDLQNRQSVGGRVKLNVEAAVPSGKKIKRITVTFADEKLYSGNRLPGSLELDTTHYRNGLNRLRAELVASNGERDAAEVELFVWNENGGETILAAGPETIAAWKPINAMPAKAIADHEKVVVTETNDVGTWGGIASPVVPLDFSRKSYAVIDVASADPQWTLQIRVEGEPWGFYVKPDGPETGPMILDVMSQMRRLKPDMPYNGIQNVELWLIVAGREGAQAAFKRIDWFYQDDPALPEADWSGRWSVSSIGEWEPIATMQGRVVVDGPIAVIREDNLLDRGGIRSPFLTIDWLRNPALSVDIAYATNQWSAMLYVKGQQEGTVIQPSTDRTGNFTYSLKEILENAAPHLVTERPVDAQIWLLAEGDNKASVGIRDFRLAYEKGASIWSGWPYAAGTIVLAAIFIVFLAWRRRSSR